MKAELLTYENFDSTTINELSEILCSDYGLDISKVVKLFNLLEKGQPFSKEDTDFMKENSNLPYLYDLLVDIVYNDANYINIDSQSLRSFIAQYES